MSGKRKRDLSASDEGSTGCQWQGVGLPGRVFESSGTAKLPRGEAGTRLPPELPWTTLLALRQPARWQGATPFAQPAGSDSQSRATVTSGPLSPQVSFHSTAGTRAQARSLVQCCSRGSMLTPLAAGFLPMRSEPFRHSLDGCLAMAPPVRTQSFTSASSSAHVPSQVGTLLCLSSWAHWRPGCCHGWVLQDSTHCFAGL